jgi:hypothetical protein
VSPKALEIQGKNLEGGWDGSVHDSYMEFLSQRMPICGAIMRRGDVDSIDTDMLTQA